MIRFGILVFDGFDELDAIAPWEVLRTAAGAGAPFETTLFTDGGPRSVRASHGLSIHVETDLQRAPPFDWVVVPGGGWVAGSPAGVGAEIVRGKLPSALSGMHASGAAMASVCTGAMLLSAAGLTRGRPATTHAIARAALRAEGADLIDARVVDDGDLVTAGGVTAGIDLALWLCERLAGAEVARAVATEMEHQRAGGVHHGGRSSHGGR